MQFALIFVLMVGPVWSQETVNDTVKGWISEVFFSTLSTTTATTTTTCPPGVLCIPGLVPVLASTTESTRGYIDKCGEGSMQGKRMCVNYEFCDVETDTIVKTRIGTRIGIDIGKNIARCGHILDRCCQIPEGGLPDGFNPNGDLTTPSPSASTSPKPTFASNRCGVRNENGIDFTIKGNNNTLAELGEFPWMVALIRKTPDPTADEEGFSFCGGSLISPNVVLTAAHCVLKYKLNPGDFKVRVGEWNSKGTIAKFPYQERNVANIILDKNYNRKSVLNDVALLVLESPIDKDQHIGTVCLPNQGQVIESTNCFFSGWGQTAGDESVYLDILKKIDLPIVPAAQCQELLRKTALSEYFVLHDSLLCAGGKAGKDACMGDGGSPLVCPDPNNPSRYVLAGMVAGGINCGDPNVPSVYVKVSKFRSWIDEQMRQLNFDTNLYIL